MPTLADMIIGAESSGDPYARNRRSSATGAGQFINSTWLTTIKRHRPDLAQGRSDADLLRMRYDPALSKEMTNAYAGENQGYLKARGFEPTQGNTYLAHFAGPGGAAAILANSDAPIERLMTPAAIAANPWLRGKTGRDVAAWAEGKMSGGQTMARNAINEVNNQSGTPSMPDMMTPPSGRNLKLADMLLAQAAQAKPTGWGSAVNALGDLALGASLGARGDQEKRDYQFKLGQNLMAAPPEALPNTMIGSGDPELMKAGVSARIAAAAPEKPTDEMREYNFAMRQRKQAGQPPIPFDQYKTELKQAGASRVNVETRQESEYEKTRGGELAKNFGEIMKAAQDANDRIGKLKSLDALLSDDRVYTGTGAGVVNMLKRAGASIGLDIRGVAEADTAQRLASEMALSLKSDLPGPVSNSDREFLLSIPPNIGDTAAGRKLLVELMLTKEQRKIEIARLAREYRKTHSGRLDDGWYDAVAEYNAANPMVTPEIISRAQQVSGATTQPRPDAGIAPGVLPGMVQGQPAGGPQQQLPTVSTKEQFDALPNGAEFMSPDGVRRRKP